MKARGFTLIEMLVVLALLGLLVSAARPLMTLGVQRQQEASLRQGLRTLRNALDEYKRAADKGRVAMSVDDSGYPPNLRVLVEGVPDLHSPQGKRIYFLRRLPRDPFADPNLPPDKTWGLRSFESTPEQPREGRDVFDVYSRSTRRALDGSELRTW